MYSQTDDNHNPETLERLEARETGEQEKPSIDVIKDDEGNLYRIEGSKKIGPLEVREIESADGSGQTVLEVEIDRPDGTAEWVPANVLPYSAENYDGGSIYGDLDLEDNGEGAASNPERIRTEMAEQPETETPEAALHIGGQMRSFEKSISSDIKELDPDLNREAPLDEYQGKLLNKLQSISEKLRLSSNNLEELLVGGEKDALARVRSDLLDSIEAQITEAPDRDALEDIERKFFQGSGDTDTENIAAGMKIDSSLSGFNLALGRVNNIPAFMELCSSIATRREQSKATALAAEQSGDEAAAHEAYEAVAESLGARDSEVIDEFLHGSDTKNQPQPNSDGGEMLLAA
jgi:hypothetical protein